jgi:putative spermidine/putrescine transport system permease protein
VEFSGHDVNKSIDPIQADVPSLTPSRKLKKLRKYMPAVLLLAPLLLFMIVFFVVPMFYILYLSLINADGLNTTNAAFSLEHYAHFFTDKYYLSSLWLTAKISLYTTLVALLLGYPVALTMSRCSPRVRGILTLIVASPLFISIIVRNFGWYLLLLPNGMVNKVLTSLHIVSAPLKLLFSETGVVIGLSNAYLPFMILTVATSLYNIDPSLEKASAILGASPLRSFMSITLPLSLPGIISGIVLVFSMSMSAYVTPALMGGANVQMLPVVAYDQIVHQLHWTYGSAVSFVLLGTTILSVTVFTRLFERGRFREVFR